MTYSIQIQSMDISISDFHYGEILLQYMLITFLVITLKRLIKCGCYFLQRCPTIFFTRRFNQTSSRAVNNFRLPFRDWLGNIYILMKVRQLLDQYRIHVWRKGDEVNRLNLVCRPSQRKVSVMIWVFRYFGHDVQARYHLERHTYCQ
jgi:hypothetical protein